MSSKVNSEVIKFKLLHSLFELLHHKDKNNNYGSLTVLPSLQYLQRQQMMRVVLVIV